MRLCQTIALSTGLPLSRSHSTTVSRWLAMPIASMSETSAPAFRMAARAVSSWVFQIASGSCSTWPGDG